jgi:integrase
LGHVRRKRFEPKFATWVDLWWATKIDLRARTLHRYERDLRLHIRPHFDHMALGRIDRTTVQAWVAGMNADGVPASGVRRRYSILRKILADAVEDERIAKTPCRKIVLPPVNRREITVLTEGEIAKLAAAMPKWCRSWVYVAAYSGLRWSEQMGLRRRDVDLLHRKINVRQQIVEVGSTFKAPDVPKTDAGHLSVKIPTSICQMLESELEHAGSGPDGLVFLNTRGNTPHHSSFMSQGWQWPSGSRPAPTPNRSPKRWVTHRSTSPWTSTGASSNPWAMRSLMPSRWATGRPRPRPLIPTSQESEVLELRSGTASADRLG